MGSAGKQLGSDPLGAIVNAYTNFATMGAYGYSKDEGFGTQNGGNFNLYDEAIGEVSGRNRGRDAAGEAEANIRNAAAAAEVARVDEIGNKQQIDIMKSRAAAGLGRGAADARGAKAGQAIDPQSAVGQELLGADKQDFLGL